MTFEIQKQDRENNQNLVRRFTKRLRNSGILLAARKSAFYHREKGEQMQRKIALRKIEKRVQYERTKKLGL